MTDPRLDLAMTAIAGALANLRVAAQVIGELMQQEQAEQPPKAEQDKGPVMFGRKPPVRPTTAVGAESQQSEG